MTWKWWTPWKHLQERIDALDNRVGKPEPTGVFSSMLWGMYERDSSVYDKLDGIRRSHNELRVDFDKLCQALKLCKTTPQPERYKRCKKGGPK